MKNNCNRFTTKVLKVFIVLVVMLLSQYMAAQKITDFVQPFIGTSNAGNTYPGAVTPWAMMSVSPHNYDYNSGGYNAVAYKYGGTKCYGLSHANLSGVGCPDLGSLLSLPKKGSMDVNAYTTGLSLSGEIAKPGYYAATIDGVMMQVATSTRASYEQYSRLDDHDTLSLMIHLSKGLSKNRSGYIKMLTPTCYEGYKMVGRFCGRSADVKLYFYFELNKTPIQASYFNDGKPKWEAERAITGNDIAVGFSFWGDVNMRMGISYVSTANAKENLKSEIPNWDFETVRNKASEQWQQELGKVKIEANDSLKTIFYTALYHSLLHPNILNDVNREYPIMGNSNKVGKVMRGKNRYTTFSLWDTYRTVHPLLALLYPQRQEDMVASMLSMYSEAGWLPKWEINSAESFTMVGDPAIITLADSYAKGIKVNVAKAAEAVIKHSKGSSEVRPGYDEFLRYKYVPQDAKGAYWLWGSVSTAQEYSYADWCGAQLLKVAQVNTPLQKELLKRSLYYRNYFDKATSLLRPKMKDQSWLTPFDALDRNKERGWAGSGGIGFVEGNAWQYSFFAPHDTKGLIQLFGGQKMFVQQLQKVFDSSYFNMNNEPDIAYPFLFNYIKGEEHRASKQVQQLFYTNFNTTAGGLPGNDDCGTLSAWAIFAMLGIFPDCPGSDVYQITAPIVQSAIINLDSKYYGKRQLAVQKLGKLSAIKLCIVNGQELKEFQITHKALVNAELLKIITE